MLELPGGEWPQSEEPGPDEQQYWPPTALVVTVVLVGTLFVMAVVGALLDWVLSVAEPRQWENVEQGVGAFATVLL